MPIRVRQQNSVNNLPVSTQHTNAGSMRHRNPSHLKVSGLVFLDTGTQGMPGPETGLAASPIAGPGYPPASNLGQMA